MEFNFFDWGVLETKIKKRNKINETLDKLATYVILNKKDTIKVLPKGKTLYRARIFDKKIDLRKGRETGFYGFNAEGSTAPKSNIVKRGNRVNRVHESVLYTADNMYTAISEARPSKRQQVSIAEIELLDNQKVAVFEFDEKGFNNEDLAEYFYSEMSLSFFLAVSENSRKEYLVTQYIASKVKEMGLDGIMYSSSLSSYGMNIALFNPGKAKANWSKIFGTQAVLICAEELLPRENNERLLPISITRTFTKDKIDEFFRLNKSI